MKDFLREKYGLLIVSALMIIYSAYFSALSIQRHNTFRTAASDMGQMDQALWNTLHGHLLEDTRDNGDRTARQAPRLTDHVEPIFLLVSLSYLVYDGVEAVLVLQSIVIALGALPVYWIARRRLKKEWAAIAFAAIYLLFPALQAANLAEFHAVTLAPAPLLLAYNYAQERAWKRFVFFSLLALAVKEDIALLVFAMAVWAAMQSTVVGGQGAVDRERKARKRITFYVSRFTDYASRFTRCFSRPTPPVLVAFLSLAWFVVALFVIVPHYSPRGESVYIGRYPQVSHDPLQLLASIPAFIGGIFIPDKIIYVLRLLASVGFVAVFDPITLLVGAPSLVLNLLSSYYAQYSGTYHYDAPVAPYFVLAAIGGTAAVSNWLARRFAVRHALAFVIAPVLAIAVGYQVLAGYTPVGGEFFWPELTPHQALLARFVNKIPPDVPVSTTKTLFPHLSHRQFLYRFPTVQDADYILLDVSQSATTNPVDFRVNYLDTLKQGYGVRDALDGYILLQRGLAQKELPDEFYNFLRACTCTVPQQPVQIDFGDKIRFLGYDVRQDDWQRVYLRTYWKRLPGLEANNYALFPFYADDNGAVRQDLALPDLLVLFWYPTMRWQSDEVIVADTLPVDVGARARIGVGVFFGARWEDAEQRLAPRTTAPVVADGVMAGELVRVGKKYEAVK